MEKICLQLLPYRGGAQEHVCQLCARSVAARCMRCQTAAQPDTPPSCTQRTHACSHPATQHPHTHAHTHTCRHARTLRNGLECNVNVNSRCSLEQQQQPWWPDLSGSCATHPHAVAPMAAPPAVLRAVCLRRADLLPSEEPKQSEACG